MNKNEIVEAVAKDACISKAAANRVIDSFMDTIKKGLKKKEKISLVGFGSFSVKERAARVGRNPQTGEDLEIKARQVVKFSPGQPLKDFIN
jgi:DNA-binding protein HU-beta